MFFNICFRLVILEIKENKEGGKQYSNKVVPNPTLFIREISYFYHWREETSTFLLRYDCLCFRPWDLGSHTAISICKAKLAHLPRFSFGSATHSELCEGLMLQAILQNKVNPFRSAALGLCSHLRSCLCPIKTHTHFLMRASQYQSLCPWQK